MGDYLKFIIWSFLDNFRENFYHMVVLGQFQRQLHHFKVKLAHFLSPNNYLHLLTTSLHFPTHQHEYEKIKLKKLYI